jgi:hypothetical protein
MDQQGHIDVADTSTATGSATYPPGVSVYDADGEKLGMVSDRQDKEDFLLVHKGRLFGHDASVPRAAIARADPDGVHLRVRKDELKGMNQTPMPEPTAPIRPSGGAPEAGVPEAGVPEAVAPGQPPMAPMAPPVPVPDMGAVAVAATAFSHDAPPEPASSTPVPSAIGAAQDAAGHAVETARAGVEQAAEAVREQVGPLAEQVTERVKEQAAEVAQQQMTSAAEGLERAAGLVSAVGDQLRERQLGELAHYTDLTVDEMQQAAAWLRATTPEEIARHVEDLAKKQPELFVAGAVALGLLGLRLLRGATQETDEKKDERK